MSRTGAEAWIEEGRALGRIEGELRAARECLQRLLAYRFEPLTEAFKKQIATSTDIEGLKAALDRVFQIKALDELNL